MRICYTDGSRSQKVSAADAAKIATSSRHFEAVEVNTDHEKRCFRKALDRAVDRHLQRGLGYLTH